MINQEDDKGRDEIKDLIIKLNNYVCRYQSRSANVSQALGVPGSKILNQLFSLVDE
jgi:hypothetical protein